MKFISTLFIISTALFSRENPFSPMQQEPKISIPQNTAPKLFKDPKPIIKQIEPIEIKEPKIVSKPKTVQKTKLIIKKQKAKTKVKVKKPKKTVIKKRIKKRIKNTTTKLIYTNRFTKVKIYGDKIQIETKDTLINDKLTKKKLSLNFEKYDTIKRKKEIVHSKYIDSLNVGFHGYYHRFIFNLKNDMMYDVQKKPYGYLITLL